MKPRLARAVVPLLLALAAYQLLSTHKHLVLRVPSVGYILYALLGGPVPGYNDPDAWGVDEVWRRPGDVIASVPIKSGTTWLLQTLHQIRTKGQDTSYDDVLTVVPWVDFVVYPGMPLSERFQLFEEAGRNVPFRVFKTHTHPPLIRFHGDTKYVVGFRHPVDLFLSSVPFFDSFEPEWKALWGGFPPAFPDPARYEKFFMDDMGGGKSAMDDFVVEFVQGWWPLRNEPNVKFVHYTDRFADMSKDVDDLAAFLGMQLSAQEKRDVLTHSSARWMKDHAVLFDIRGLLKRFHAAGVLSPAVQGVLKPGSVVNRAGLVKPPAAVPGRLAARIRTYLESRLGHAVTKWLFEGGPVPDEQLKPAP